MTRSFKNALSLEEIKVGDDLLLIFTGGTSHIGAVSTAFFTDLNASEIKVETTSVPGHKEYLLSETFARRCAQKLRRTVTIVMGIHFDHLQKTELDDLIAEAQNKLDVFLNAKE